MSRFGSTLLRNIKALPASLPGGLRPGKSDSLPRLMRRNFWYHIHPVRVLPETLNPVATLGLGVITATLFVLLCVTGVLLMIYYIPTTQQAYRSTQDIQYAVAFGGFVRALHRWAAHGMVLTAFLHLLRVLCTGSYAKRELNWIIGLGLFILTMALAFTGYLLPWDQLSFWAVSVASNLLDHLPLAGKVLKQLALGGDTVGQSTLIRFYALHVALLPGMTIVLVILHLWRVRKDGGLARNKPEDHNSETIPAWPHMILREAIIVISVVAIFALVSIFVDAPLGGMPDIHNPSNPEKTPWYFLWLQEMVSYSAPIGGFVFPGVMLAAFVCLPFLDREDDQIGTWFGDKATRRALWVTFFISSAFLGGFEYLFNDPSVSSWFTGRSPLMRDLLNPATGMLVLSIFVFLFAGHWLGSTRGAFLAAATVIIVAVIGFTIVAVCRGPSWVFYWPWEEWPLVS